MVELFWSEPTLQGQTSLVSFQRKQRLGASSPPRVCRRVREGDSAYRLSARMII